MPKRCDSGVTLPELLVVLALSSLLMTLAIPTFSALLERSRVTAAHNELLLSLHLLRSEAAKRHAIVKMCRGPGTLPATCDTAVGGGWHTGWAIWVDQNRNNQIDASEPVIRVQNGFQNDVRMTGNTNVANRLAFQPWGGTSGVGNGTFTICVPGGSMSRQIVISKPGRIRTVETPGGGSC